MFQDEILNWVQTHLKSDPLFLGISAAQGCGKTTLSSSLVEAFAEQGQQAIAISVDDFYFPRDKIRLLSGNNPYLQTRGYPGTHDVELGSKVLSALKQGRPCRVPIFDKSLHDGEGDRSAEIVNISQKQNVVILEGWMLGFVPQKKVSDPHLQEINEYLKEYESWIRHLDLFLYLRPEQTQYTVDWRIEAEANRRAQGLGAMTPEEVERYIRGFLPAYELYGPSVSSRQNQFKGYREYSIDKSRGATLKVK